MASLSVDNLGRNRWRIRWRELVPGVEGRPQRGEDGRLLRRSRSQTVESKEARDAMVAMVRAAILAEGAYDPPAVHEAQAPEPVPDAPTVANLEQAAVAWLEWKATRCKPVSCVRYAGQMKRFFQAVRGLLRIRTDAAVAASVLSRDLLISVERGWQREGLSESFVYNAARGVLEMWNWIADDAANYPGVPSPPRHGKSVLPRPPIYSAPPAPSLAECDAALRALPDRAELARRLGIVLRFTGLRLSQVLAMRRADINLVAAEMTVRKGKSRIEEAECRTVPISRALVAQISPWLADAPPEAPVIAPRVGREGLTPSNKALRFKAAWEKAVAAGEARQAVWNPPNRKQARPEHAFRAAFQAHLRLAGVSEPVIDALVGHHSGTTRARHYAGVDTLVVKMREAVDAMPGIDWIGPEGRGANVVKIRGGAGRQGER